MSGYYSCICGKSAKEILSGSASAEVIAVHSESVYIRTEQGDMLLLCSDKYGEVPFGISFEDLRAIKSAREYLVGEKVIICDFSLTFSDGETLSIENRCRTAYPAIPGRAPDRKAILLCYDIVSERASERGIGTVLGTLLCVDSPRCDSNAFARIVAGIADTLESSVVRLDFAGVDVCVKKLVGLGYGLTPSGDDFLCGMLYAFNRFSHFSEASEKYARVVSRAVEGHLSDTSVISQRYLRCAISGDRFELTDAFIAALCSYPDDATEAELIRSAEALMSVGASSGSDIICGILFASYMLM